MSLYPAVPSAASPARVSGWPPELGDARVIAVRLGDLRSPLRRPAREGDRTALTAAGAGTIRAGDVVVFCSRPRSRRRWSAATGGYRLAGTRPITPGSGLPSSGLMR